MSWKDAGAWKCQLIPDKPGSGDTSLQTLLFADLVQANLSLGQVEYTPNPGQPFTRAGREHTPDDPGQPFARTGRVYMYIWSKPTFH